jgi:cytochrome c oxidase subunit III
MSERTHTLETPVALRAEAGVRHVPNAVLGVMIFVAAEVMFFAALISAHTIARSTALGGMWPPPGQPRLPVERTGFNTAVLLLSGALLWLANRYLNSMPGLARRYLEGAVGLGIAFVSLQGVEWVALLREGLTLRSSSHGAFFYLIVGAHAVHAVAAIVALAWVYLLMRRGKQVPEAFAATQVFWYFVVLVWPVIYLRVYF